MQDFGDLNEAQLEAVTAGDGPTLIIAGPGTGKTKTLTARIAWLLEHSKASPDDIVALTFTNKAAREMRERLKNQLKANSATPTVTTFHALGAGLLKQKGDSGKLLTELQRMEIIRQLSKPAAFKSLSTRELGFTISHAKTTLYGSLDTPSRQLLARYESALANEGKYDFDDLLVRSLKLLRDVSMNAPRYASVLVDEFQDTSELQYELLKLLGADNNVFAIGDPNQSIYAFRGAGAEMFGRFQKDFPEVREINLTLNYRSRPEIIKLANSVFPGSPQLEAISQQPGSVELIQTLNEYSEAAYVISEIEKGIGGSDMLKASGGLDDREPREYAVLYRTHRAGRNLQRAFAESGIPYQIAGEGSPYEQPIVQGIIGLMRYTLNPDNSSKQELTKLPSLKCPSPHHVDTLLVKLSRPEDSSVYEFATRIAQLTAPTEEHNLQQFLSMLVQFGACSSGLATCLDYIDRLSETEFYDSSVNAVTLMTIHAAKGLEFARVFLCAAEEGVLPKVYKGGETDMAEERRMFYVALTRAKEKLDILHTRFRHGEASNVSRFVAKIPEMVLPRSVDPSMAVLQRRAEKRRQKRAQSSLF